MITLMRETSHTTSQFAPRVTISDLSSELGLAKGTVSRALNNYADISASTKLRVKQAAEKMGYRPLSHAQAIKTGRVRSVGLVLQNFEHDGHRPFLADFLAGISNAASQEGWTMTLAMANSEEHTRDTLARLVDERKADGFILPRTYLKDARIDSLREADVPFVLYGRTEDQAGCAWYDIDMKTAFEQAVTQLTNLGHQRIAFLPGGDGFTYSKIRYQGYVSGLTMNGLSYEASLVGKASVDQGSGYENTGQLMAAAQPPTAFICAVDQAALGVYQWASERGLQIGRDISVISYDGIPEGAMMTPPLSTFAVDNQTAGARLTELLIARIRGAAPENLRELGPATFLNRGSHGPVSPAGHMCQKTTVSN